MSSKRVVLAILILSALAVGAEQKYVLSAKRLSTTEEAISCNNGGDPTGTKIGDTLIISCGK